MVPRLQRLQNTRFSLSESSMVAISYSQRQ